jgi:aryl-alcohol dehydrogenase-like predicted oxidoreductase
LESNADIVDGDNFTKLYDGRPISKIACGTDGAKEGIHGDFLQYIGLKQALMSGGVNHVDTAAHFRSQNSERVVGQVLRTLTHKYGYNRD